MTSITMRKTGMLPVARRSNLAQVAAAALLITAAPAAAAAASPPSAPSAPSLSTTQAGGWSIVPGDEDCTMAAGFEGPGNTTLAFTVMARTGDVMLVVLNQNWKSIVEGKKYDLRIVLDGGRLHADVEANGFAGDNAMGLVTSFSSTLIGKQIGAGHTLQLYTGTTFLAGVVLTGSAKAFEATVACAMKQLKTSAGDPFSKDGGPSVAPKAAVPRIDPSYWIGGDDYPPEAQREHHGGITTVQLSIGADGNVSDCLITGSSGYPELDQTTCKLLLRRARYFPATDSAGKPVASMASRKVTWSLPAEPVSAPVQLKQ